jgi:ribonuclease P protein component
MIHRTHRFHGRSSLSFVYRRGQSVRGPLVSLRYILNERIKSYRVAVVVSRKVSKSAVVRNRIRRRIYEAVREVEAGITDPYDLVFVVYGEDLAKLRSRELRSTVSGQLVKAGVLKPAPSSATSGKRAIVEPKETDT